MVQAKSIVWEMKQNVHCKGLVYEGTVPRSNVRFTIHYEGDGLPGAPYVLECSIGKGTMADMYLSVLMKQAQLQLDSLVYQLVEQKRPKMSAEQKAFIRKYGRFAEQLNLKLELENDK